MKDLKKEFIEKFCRVKLKVDTRTVGAGYIPDYLEESVYNVTINLDKTGVIDLIQFIQSLLEAERKKTLEEVGKIKIPKSLWKHDIKLMEWWDKEKKKILLKSQSE